MWTVVVQDRVRPFAIHEVWVFGRYVIAEAFANVERQKAENRYKKYHVIKDERTKDI